MNFISRILLITMYIVDYILYCCHHYTILLWIIGLLDILSLSGELIILFDFFV